MPLIVALAALVVLVVVDGWRIAALVALAGAAIAATRVRYAPAAAAGLAVLVAALAVAGGPIGGQERPTRAGAEQPAGSAR